MVDIRSIPRSLHNPQFNFDTFPKILRNRGINYRHEKKLGGLRKQRKDSINMAWENSSFRGFADYMQSDDFIDRIDDYKARAKKADSSHVRGGVAMALSSFTYR